VHAAFNLDLVHADGFETLSHRLGEELGEESPMEYFLFSSFSFTHLEIDFVQLNETILRKK